MESLKKSGILKVCLVLCSYVLAYLYVDKLNLSFYGDSIGEIFTTLIITFGFVVWLELVMLYQRVTGIYKPSRSVLKETRFWEVILMLLAGITHFGTQSGLEVFAMHLVVIYMVLCGTGHLLKEESSCLLPFDLVNGALRLPFGNFVMRIPFLADGVGEIRNSGNKDGKKMGLSLGKIIGSIIFIVVAFVVFFQVFGLLSELDSTFNIAFTAFADFIRRCLRSIFRFDIFILGEKLGLFILSIPVGAYLSGLFNGSARHDNDFEKNIKCQIENACPRLRIIPEVLFCVVCSIFIVMYLLFFISQSRLLFSGFLGILPEEFTASAYARDGFSQLANVLMINFAGLGAMRIFATKSVVESKYIKLGSTVLMATSMIFSVISASKIILYISRFGYTALRTESLWFTVVAFVGSMLAIVNIVTSKKTFKFWLWFSAASFIIMNIVAGFCQL